MRLCLQVRRSLCLLQYGVKTAMGILESVQVLLAVFLPIFGFIWERLQRRKLKHLEMFQREAHNLRLFRALSDKNRRLQMAAAAVLMERLNHEPSAKRSKLSDREAIIRALISVIKDSPGDRRVSTVSPELSKFIADNLPKALRAFAARGPKAGSPSPLKDYDWQGAHLDGAWWQDIDARGVDFFGAHLSYAGMRRAHLVGAVLKQAILRDSTFVGADLRGADLRGADLCGANFEGANLENAKLDGATFDERTKLPIGIDRVAAHMVDSATVAMNETSTRHTA
jgi:hypothetical protein